MRVDKICDKNDSTVCFKHSRCSECLDSEAEFVIVIGGWVAPLCADCLWDIKDMIDETTLTNFVSVTRTKKGTENMRHEFKVVKIAED